MRIGAASLAKALYNANISSERPEILEKWMLVIVDTKKSAKIKTA